jgi:alkanesulfonate monooxygenase SsuD/methylene tetrahydromethanopterin reductase-like flavin-dependent oxidoreductase (luciferase family)
MAGEWLTIIKRLWTEDDPFDFDGEFYKVRNATMRPKPVQKPHPVVMCAGVSPAGRAFAAQHCDVSFTSLDSQAPDAMRARAGMLRDLARREHGREIQVWCNAYIFQGDTEQDARRYFEHAIHQHGDLEGLDNMLTTMGINSQSIPPEALPSLRDHFLAGWGGYQIIGTSEQVVEKLALLSDCGFDGVLLSWPRYLQDMARFQAETWPLVQQSGLR